MASDPSVSSELMDDSLMVAMQAARRHHLIWWLSELERHRQHRSFWPWTCARSLEYGFTCGCSGCAQDYAIRVGSFREMLPEARASVMRMFSRAVGKGVTREAVRRGLRVEKKARAILYRFLTREQKWHLRATGLLVVTGSDGRSYEISRGIFNNIKVSWRGHDLRLCVQPVRGSVLPVSDTMLYQKVLLEADARLVLDAAFVQDATTGLSYNSGSFIHDGSDPRVKSSYRTVQVTVPESVLDSPQQFMHEQMTQDLTAVQVVSEGVSSVSSERVETVSVSS